MKAYYQFEPKPIELIGLGKYYCNMNIHQVEVGTDIEGETHVEWECEQVMVEGYPTYKKVVVALIAERYDHDDEIAILRQAATRGSEFDTYNAFCEDCKAMARQLFKEGGE